MALDLLGEAFDVQGGGSDLVFPHHEMCAAQAAGAHRQAPFARPTCTPAWSGYDGEKMSQVPRQPGLRLGAARSGVDPMAIRLTLLRHHYRSDWEWTDAELWDVRRPARPLASAPCALGCRCRPRAAVVDDVLAAGSRRPRRPRPRCRRRRLGGRDSRDADRPTTSDPARPGSDRAHSARRGCSATRALTYRPRSGRVGGSAVLGRAACR